MTQFSGRIDRRSRLSILGFAISIAGCLMLNERAAAADFCVWEDQPEVGQLAPSDDLAIRNLIADFYYKTYDSPQSDADRLGKLKSLFAETFLFEVCTGGGNNQLFIAKDFKTLEEQISTNYHALWDNAIKPMHSVSSTVLTLVDKDVVQEKSNSVLHIQGPNNPGPIAEYTADIRGIVVKNAQGRWVFAKRFLIIDNPSIVSYAR